MKLVNESQTPEERREKYWLARSCGKNASWARAMRDWHILALEYRLGLKDGKSEKTTLSKGEC